MPTLGKMGLPHKGHVEHLAAGHVADELEEPAFFCLIEVEKGRIRTARARAFGEDGGISPIRVGLSANALDRVHVARIMVAPDERKAAGGHAVPKCERPCADGPLHDPAHLVKAKATAHGKEQNDVKN